jgi:hypothetical protein
MVNKMEKEIKNEFVSKLFFEKINIENNLKKLEIFHDSLDNFKMDNEILDSIITGLQDDIYNRIDIIKKLLDTEEK